MLKKIAPLVLILLCSVGIATATIKHTIMGSDVGGTKGLLSYNRIENDELHYPSDYLRSGTIVRRGDQLCTAVNGLPTEARGWPFYYAVDDPNCSSVNIFPILYILDVVLFTLVFGMVFVIVRKIVKS